MVGASTNSVASAGSGIGSIHLTNVQLEYAPTASPELSLTNTGSSASNNQSILGVGTTTTTKREPYLRNWFMSQSSASSAHSANAASNMPSHTNASGGNSVSANASPAASSLNAISMDSTESNYQKMKQFSLQQLHSTDTQLPIENSSSTSSVLSSQHHSSITTNASKIKFPTNGEHNGHSSNQLNNSHSHSADVSVKDDQPKQSTSQQKQQQKSSRRTTSLLNLFMSNSQGNNS